MENEIKKLSEDIAACIDRARLGKKEGMIAAIMAAAFVAVAYDVTEESALKALETCMADYRLILKSRGE